MEDTAANSSVNDVTETPSLTSHFTMIGRYWTAIKNNSRNYQWITNFWNEIKKYATQKRSYSMNIEDITKYKIRNKSALRLSEEDFTTLASVTLSSSTVETIVTTEFFTTLLETISEFCELKHNNVWGKISGSNVKANDKLPLLHISNISAILNFLAELCRNENMRTYLNNENARQIWPQLLSFMCGRGDNNLNREQFPGALINKLEDAVIRFFNRVCSCHSQNQTAFISVLCSVSFDPINNCDEAKELNKFTKRLLSELVLNGERIFMSVSWTDNLDEMKPEQTRKDSALNSQLLYLNATVKCGDAVQLVMLIDSPKKRFGPGREPEPSDKDYVDIYDGFAVEPRVKPKKRRRKRLMLTVKKRKTTKQGDTNNVPGVKIKLLTHASLPEGNYFSPEMSLRCIVDLINEDIGNLHTSMLELTMISKVFKRAEDVAGVLVVKSKTITLLEEFVMNGGLNLIAHSFPSVYPSDSSVTPFGVYEEGATPFTMPMFLEDNPHSLVMFGQCLKLSNYGHLYMRNHEEILVAALKSIFVSKLQAAQYQILNKPFELDDATLVVLLELFESVPLTLKTGLPLRQHALNIGIIQMILMCLAVFTRHSEAFNFSGSEREKYSWLLNLFESSSKRNESEKKYFNGDTDENCSYWEKGTGYGTGSHNLYWDLEAAMSRQRSQEKLVITILKIICSYINTDQLIQNKPREYIVKRLRKSKTANELTDSPQIPPEFVNELSQFGLISILTSYLKNDSVMDIMARIPLYDAILAVLRSMAVNSQLLHLLLPQKSSSNSTSLIKLLSQIKSSIGTYTARLKSSSTAVPQNISRLVSDIENTAKIIQIVAGDLLKCDNDDEIITENGNDAVLTDNKLTINIQERYLKVMKSLQFDTYDIISFSGRKKIFNIPYHFSNDYENAINNAKGPRVKRLAQELHTLSTSLPLSYGSSIFVRYDAAQMDIMKVLIIGPAGTPYEDGCFEFDIYFPSDYPSVPLNINLRTNGGCTVRFNPNLYPDGKVCLSILNTWEGRPEEMWNASTSNLLQVLVSIQSLILVPEPYFNEPGYECTKDTEAGKIKSNAYNLSIYEFNVQWAMFKQLASPTKCFKEVIQTHFWLKRQEIANKIRAWLHDFYVSVTYKDYNLIFYRVQERYKLLCNEFEMLPVPSGFEDVASLPEFQFVRPDLKFLDSNDQTPNAT